MFLYLTTIGRTTGNPREIEIWFTERGGRFYLIAEQYERANWVRNVAANGGGATARFHWHDLASEPVETRYDAIVMNPPFHTGRAAEPGIGQGLIAVAARALRKGGRLVLVANRQLPYEKPLAAAFAKVDKIVEDRGFKVLSATR